MPPSRAGRPATARHLAHVLTLSGALAGAGRQARAQLPFGLFGGKGDTTGQGLIDRARVGRRDVVLGAPGPGLAGPTIRAILARPHLTVFVPDTGATFGRGAHADLPLVVVGGPVRMAGRVHGDLVVFGDLFLRPGAQVDGRAIAVGGGVYGSTLAIVSGDVLPYRELAVAQSTTSNGASLALSTGPSRPVPFFSLPGVVGVRLPTYDRIDGVNLSAGPEIAFDTGRVRLEPSVTYRSHLGDVDPGARARVELGPRTRVDAVFERSTYSNDAWIRGDFTNSLSTLASGNDVRNYYRAVRAEATVTRRIDLTSGVIEPYLGAGTERAESVARDTGSTSYPFSFLSRKSLEGSRRANPGVTGGRITSAIAGGTYRVETPRLAARFGARVERSLDVTRGAQFTQATLDAVVALPTRDEHLFQLLAHGVATAGGRGVPSQRYAYLGGDGTLPSLFLMQQGGTELAWAEARYTIPVRVVHIPFGGVPTLTARAMGGAAGVDHLAGFTPNLGVRASVSLLRVDYVFDPRGRGRRVFSFGLGLR